MSPRLPFKSDGNGGSGNGERGSLSAYPPLVRASIKRHSAKEARLRIREARVTDTWDTRCYEMLTQINAKIDRDHRELTSVKDALVEYSKRPIHVNYGGETVQPIPSDTSRVDKDSAWINRQINYQKAQGKLAYQKSSIRLSNRLYLAGIVTPIIASFPDVLLHNVVPSILGAFIGSFLLVCGYRERPSSTDMANVLSEETTASLWYQNELEKRNEESFRALPPPDVKS